MEGKGAALLAALLVAASALAAIPSCSADANTTTQPIKPQASPPSSGDTSRSVAIVFNLEGNVYPNGEFHVQMNFGNSHNYYTMNIDTGSDVPWVECEVPTTQAVYPRPQKDKMIPCDDPRCKAVLAATGSKGCVSKERCDYQIEYVDSFAEGVLIADTLTLRLTNGNTIRPMVAFGCGRWRTVNDKPAPTHGNILGLGFAEISILSQLSSQGIIGKVTGHCLNSRGGGFLFLGDYGRLPSGITWAPMTPSKHYSLGHASLLWDKQHLASSPEVLLDSGTTYTYFAFDSYNSLIFELIRYASTQPLKRALDDRTLPYCWRGPQSFKYIADAERYFKISLEMRFANEAALMKLPPLNYLIISKKGNACLGILNGTQNGLDRDVSLIGDISMLNQFVIYDNEKQQIGWANTDYCRV